MPNSSLAVHTLSSIRQELQACFILHQRPFKETSLILEVFSEQHGRLSVLAKGAKRERSRWKGLLQPFVPLFLSWIGKTDLKILVDAQADGPAHWFGGLTLFSGLYVNELLVKTLGHHYPHLNLYKHYAQLLSELALSNNQNLNVQMSLRKFEYQLLSELGYGTDVKIDSKTGLAIQPRIEIQKILGGRPIHSRLLVKKLV